MWDIGLESSCVSVIKNKAKCKYAPHNGQVTIKWYYFFKSNPSSSAQWLRVIFVVFFCVPILLVIPFPINMVLVCIFFSNFLIMIIIWSIFLIQIFKSFSSKEMLPSWTLFPVVFHSFQEILIVFVIFKCLFNPFLLLFMRLLYSFLIRPFFPVLVRFLIIEIPSCRVSKD